MLFDGQNQVSGREGYRGYRCTRQAVCGLVVRNNFFPPVVADAHGLRIRPDQRERHTAVFVGFSLLMTPCDAHDACQ
jgi:hypothetical protein